MTAQKGSLVLIKVGNGGGPETFTTIAGLRTSRLYLNNQPMDSTNKSSGPWRQLLGNSGTRSINISGSGLFTDAASEELLRGYAFASSVNNYQFVFANGDYITGAFQIIEYERSGVYDDAEIFTIALESAGDAVFAAV